MEYHGMIISLMDNKAIVSTSTFECYYIKRSPRMHIGKHIDFSEKEIIKGRLTPVKLLLGVACIAIVCLIAFASLTNMKSLFFEPEVFAYVDVDINPSLEFAIDDMSNVLSIEPLNEDAKVLVKELNLTRVTVSHAIDAIIGKLGKNNVISESGKDYILISSTLNNEKDESSAEYRNERKKLENIVNALGNNIKINTNGKVNVFLMQTNIHERTAARSKSISTGRYALYNRNKDLGNHYSIEEAKTININELLKDILSNMEEKGVHNKVKPTQYPFTQSTPFLSTPVSTPSPLNTSTIIPNRVATSFSKSNSPTPTLVKDMVHDVNNWTPINPTKNTPAPSPTPAPAPTQRTQNANFPIVKLESSNYRGYYIQHQQFNGLISDKANLADDLMFKMVPGLADPTCISLESKNFPGHYLMHDNFRIILKKHDDSVSFKENATFRKVPGLFDKNLVSFQSYNYPKRYIRHRVYNLYAEEITTELEKKDATYIVVKDN